MTRMRRTTLDRSSGFTLMELTVVLVIVALLLGGLLMPLSAQHDGEAIRGTEKSLAEIRDALLGFAATNGRLPCPASATSAGRESYCTAATGTCVATTPDVTPAVLAHGKCTNPYDGFIPGVSLGLSTVDAQGYVADGWADGSATHRIRYAVATDNSAYSYTQLPGTTTGMKAKTIASLSPELRVCNAGANVTNPGNPATATCAVNTFLASDAVAVIYSLGKNAATSGTSDDDQHNPNPNTTVAADPAFVKATTSPTFGHLIIWLSKYSLYDRMISANQLP